MSIRVRVCVLTALVWSACALPSAAQAIEGGIKIGVSLGTVSNPFVIASSTGKDEQQSLSGLVGAFVTFGSGARVAFQPELLVTSQRTDLEGESEDEDDENDLDRHLILRYIEVPMLVRFGVSGVNAGAYLLAGPNLGFRIKSAIRTSVGDADPEDEDIDDRVKTANIGLTAAAGVQGDRWLVEGRWTQGLTNIAAGNDADSVRTRSIGILVGLRF